MITVCQCNILDGGRWSNARRTTADYTTALRFSRFVASVNPPGSAYPPIGVIGMQELVRDADERATLDLLQSSTRADWSSQRIPQGVDGGSGIGMFWRPDLVETRPHWDLGAKEIERLDSGYIIKFSGRLFRELKNDLLLALFTGKLAWRKAVLHGKHVTDEERRLEARRVLEWAQESVAASRQALSANIAAVIATDLNSSVGSSAWSEVSDQYSDPSRQNTFDSNLGNLLLDVIGKRFDYVWLQRGGPAEFVDGPRRSPHFGSDHRAVYATIGQAPLPDNPEYANMLK